MIKIGIFTECYKPTVNGVVSSIETFREQLEKQGYQFFIFAPQHKYAQPQKNVFRVPSFTWPTVRDYPIGLPYFSHLENVVSSLKLDLVHCQHIFLMGSYGQSLAKKLSLPCVYTYHTVLTEYVHYLPIKSLWGLAKKFLIKRAKNFCNQSDRIIVPSRPIASLLKSYGVTTPIVVIPTGIDLRKFRKLSRKERSILLTKFKIPYEKEILLFVGRLAQEKNLDFLINCFKEILEIYPSTHLVLVGDGPERENLKNMIERFGLKKAVTLTGFLEPAVTRKFFGAADLFVFPSTTETQGIVVAESLASSTPVVAVDYLGPKDLVQNGENGFLVPLKQKDFINKTILLLQNLYLRKRMEGNARKSVQAFSIRRSADKLAMVYQELVKAKK